MCLSSRGGAPARPCPPPSVSRIVLSSLLSTMPRTDPQKAGAIVHAASNRVLCDHSAKNIFGGNFAKHFLQGTVVNMFDGREPWGENAVWKLTVDYEMPSKDPCRRRCASCAIESTRGERSGRVS